MGLPGDTPVETGPARKALIRCCCTTRSPISKCWRGRQARGADPGWQARADAAENCTVGFYRYIYDAVGEPWLWFERRLFGDAALLQLIAKPTIEIFVLYVGGVPAGFFELDAAEPRETKLCYFGLVPDFIGRGYGAYLLQAAIDRAWTARPIDRFWLHTSTYDHPHALRSISAPGSASTPAAR